MLALVDPNARVPKDHPIRRIKTLADDALAKLSRSFDEIYGKEGRPSVPPETLLKATILMALYTVRSERQFCEQLDYNILFRWFLDMDLVEPSFDHSTFSKNRRRLIEADIAKAFFKEIVAAARGAHLLSNDHFSADGSLIEAMASHKSLRPRDEPPPPSDKDDPGNPTVNYRGEQRGNDTHVSSTDPEAKLAKKNKGTGAKLSFLLHALCENRNGLLVDAAVTEAVGVTEREAALHMLKRTRPNKGASVGADAAYNSRGFVEGCRELGIVPHVAQGRGNTAIDGRTTRHNSYVLSQRFRKRIEEIFGWAKSTGGLRRTRFKGRLKTEFYALLVGTAYNMLRIAKLMPRTA